MRLDHISKANIKLFAPLGGKSSELALGIRVASCSLDSERRSPAEVFTKKGTRRKKRPKISGGDIEEATPDPIPNSEVKLFGADGTAREAVWESRTLPGLF